MFKAFFCFSIDSPSLVLYQQNSNIMRFTVYIVMGDGMEAIKLKLKVFSVFVKNSKKNCSFSFDVSLAEKCVKMVNFKLGDK